MARIRKFTCYRRLKRPYTRKSKYRKKAFVRANPSTRIVKFHVGNPKGKFDYAVDLISKEAMNIRDNSIESSRTTINRYLEKNLGRSGYHMHILVFPHHILREHSLASGAGADRFSSGMAHPFGKPIGLAARVRENQPIMTVHVNKQNIPAVRIALARAKHKLPCKVGLVIRENTKVQ